MHDATFRVHGPGILCQWTHQVELQLERGPPITFSEI
jgi:hypothetical protein